MSEDTWCRCSIKQTCCHLRLHPNWTHVSKTFPGAGDEAGADSSQEGAQLPVNCRGGGGPGPPTGGAGIGGRRFTLQRAPGRWRLCCRVLLCFFSLPLYFRMEILVRLVMFAIFCSQGPSRTVPSIFTKVAQRVKAAGIIWKNKCSVAKFLKTIPSA